jgi:hypothetical protein
LDTKRDWRVDPQEKFHGASVMKVPSASQEYCWISEWSSDKEMTENAMQESARASRKMWRVGRMYAWNNGMVVAGTIARGVGKRVETGGGSSAG